MKKHLIALLGLLSLSLVACGTGEEEKKDRVDLQRPASSGDLTRGIDCYGGEATALALTDYRLRQIPAEDLAFLDGDQTKSLCDHIRGAGSQLTFLTFVSASCYSCMIWAEELALDTAGSGIGLTIVVTDSEDVLSTADVAALKAQVAPDATWIRDDFGELWGFFGEGERTSPMVVAMDDFAQGFFVDGDETTQEIVDQANARMGFEFSIGAE